MKTEEKIGYSAAFVQLILLMKWGKLEDNAIALDRLGLIKNGTKLVETNKSNRKQNYKFRILCSRLGGQIIAVNFALHCKHYRNEHKHSIIIIKTN